MISAADLQAERSLNHVLQIDIHDMIHEPDHPMHAAAMDLYSQAWTMIREGGHTTLDFEGISVYYQRWGLYGKTSIPYLRSRDFG